MSKLKNLTDTFGRRHNYLRISLTERCNLRCLYCMPEKGIDLTHNDKLLKTDELLRLVDIFSKAGVEKIRLTGGEPTVRKDILEICKGIKENKNIKNLAMTTNGISLGRMLLKLQDSGLDSLNISLDTLVPDKFEFFTRRKGHNLVMKSINKALELGYNPVKVNCVVMKNKNDDEIIDFVKLTKDKPINIRFIEYMPFDDNKRKKKKLVSFFEMRDIITKEFGELKRENDHFTETAKNYKLPGHTGSVSFITSMTSQFCGGCNRTRLLADGNYKVCLFGQKEISLRDAMREGMNDSELLNLINGSIIDKKEKHGGMLNIQKMKNRPMITIGG